jgi:hypothetical protein
MKTGEEQQELGFNAVGMLWVGHPFYKSRQDH